ncbi:MAG: GAF domain-containing protein [Chloroflexi bacterium]|nr:GAF domain-containing protein [Chloroflexota bacterium]
MSILVDESSFPLTSRASRPVDGALVNLRWAVIVLAWLVVFLVTGNPIPENYPLLWIVTYATFNALLLIGVHYQRLPERLPILGLVGDILFTSILPLLPGVNSSFLSLFTIFPTLVAAMRFGITKGALVAVLVLLPYEAAAVVQFLPENVRVLVPLHFETDINFFAALLPILAVMSAVVVVGYLTEREREAAIGAAHVELAELRQAISSARLFYESADSLNGTSNYVQILDVMLQAGVNGMPRGHFDQGAPVGIAFVFGDVTESGDKPLLIAASRGLDRNDAQRSLPGEQGVIAQAIKTGDPIPFSKVTQDPELAHFASLRRAHNGVCYPLQSGLEVYGAVILASPSAQKPSEQHLRLMRAFINQAAIAFQNAQLYQNLRAERDHIIEAEAAARAKLARDLHDGPTQSMAALAMRLDFIRLLLDRDAAQAKQELEQAREAVMRVGKDLRGLLFTLRPLTLETQGLSAALKQYEQRLRDNDNVPIDIQPGNLGNELDTNIAATVFAVIEEAVNNARKHARGAPIHVNVQQQSTAIIATVADEGPGFDMSAVDTNYNARGSLGMVNMRDRARLVEGHLTVESAPGRGTRITLRVPLHAQSTTARTAASKHT